jgi:hypothetical protein
MLLYIVVLLTFLGICSVYIYRCHVLCIGAIILTERGYIRLYHIVMWNFFFTACRWLYKKPKHVAAMIF